MTLCPIEFFLRHSFFFLGPRERVLRLYSQESLEDEVL
jgi:hypothetical protein